jgi:hypothetical protein
VTARQSRLVDPRWLSINSDSSSQSAAESSACSGPSNSFTALMNAANSRSAICVCCLQIELENDFFVFIGSSSGAITPEASTRNNWTMVSSTPSYRSAGVRRSLTLLFKLLSPLPSISCCRSSAGELIPKYNGHAPTGWLILLWKLTRGATAEALGEELL